MLAVGITEETRSRDYEIEDLEMVVMSLCNCLTSPVHCLLSDKSQSDAIFAHSAFINYLHTGTRSWITQKLPLGMVQPLQKL